MYIINSNNKDLANDPKAMTNKEAKQETLKMCHEFIDFIFYFYY